MEEVLYTDNRRLDSYVSRLQPALSTDTAPTLKLGAKFAVTGPEVSGEFETHTRSMTFDEKRKLLLAALQEEKLLRRSRPSTEAPKPPFVLEATDAVRVVVPPQRGHVEHPGIILWISTVADWSSSGPNEGGASTLCLLEDHQERDHEPVSFRHASTYTLLQSLLYYTRTNGIRTVIDDKVPNDPHPNRYASFAGKPPSLRQYHNAEPWCHEFVTNPVELLERWGCIVSPPRSIETVYRIREIGGDSVHKWERVTVFGYPIWIASR